MGGGLGTGRVALRRKVSMVAICLCRVACVLCKLAEQIVACVCCPSSLRPNRVKVLELPATFSTESLTELCKSLEGVKKSSFKPGTPSTHPLHTLYTWTHFSLLDLPLLGQHTRQTKGIHKTLQTCSLFNPNSLLPFLS